MNVDDAPEIADPAEEAAVNDLLKPSLDDTLDQTLDPSIDPSIDPTIEQSIEDNGTNLPADEDDDDEDDDDDDDDDIKITIGEIKADAPNYPPISFNVAKRSPAFIPGAAKTKNVGLNVDAVGTYEGTSIYEFNLDTIEEKPWRKPGADITDYFNYGFTEETWKIYCEKQKKIQQELASGTSSNGEPIIRRNNTIGGDRGPPGINLNDSSNIVVTPHSTPGPKGSNSGPPQVNSESPIPVASVNENSKYSGMGLTKKAGPPPGRKPSGTIDVIGGGTPSTPSVITSRRPLDAPDNNFSPMMSSVPPGPGIPPGPFHYPPPPFGIPPPHAGMEFLPPHHMGPRGMSPSVLGNVPPSTNFPPPHLVDYGMLIPKRERDDDHEDRDRGDKDDDRDKRDRRDKRRERDDRDKRDRRDRDKHIKKERRDDRDRDREEREKRDSLRRRSDRDKSEKRHRDDKDDRDDKHDKKRKKSESESRDREERERRERRERDEKEKKER